MFTVPSAPPSFFDSTNKKRSPPKSRTEIAAGSLEECKRIIDTNKNKKYFPEVYIFCLREHSDFLANYGNDKQKGDYRNYLKQVKEEVERNYPNIAELCRVLLERFDRVEGLSSK